MVLSRSSGFILNNTNKRANMVLSRSSEFKYVIAQFATAIDILYEYALVLRCLFIATYSLCKRVKSCY